MLSVLRIGLRWRRNVRNRIGMRNLDILIEAEAVRLQRAFRLHEEHRRQRALLWSVALAPSRPRVASPKNARRKDALMPSKARGTIVVPSTPFDPISWFEPPEMLTARESPTRAVKWSDEPVPTGAARPSRPSTGGSAGRPVALPGTLGETALSWGFHSVVEDPRQAPKAVTTLERVQMKKAESIGNGAAYQLAERTGSTNLSVSVSEVVVARQPSPPRRIADAPAEMTFATPAQRFKRRLATRHAGGRKTLAARAHVLASRAVEALRYPMVHAAPPAEEQTGGELVGSRVFVRARPPP